MLTIQKSLPDDVIIEPYLDRTDLVNRAISTVEKNLIEGALIVIFVLVLFLGNFRAGLIVASAIPLIYAVCLGYDECFWSKCKPYEFRSYRFWFDCGRCCYYCRGNNASLGIKESKGKINFHQEEMDGEVLVSAAKIRKSASFGEIIILIVYIPILTLVGIEGKMFVPMAQTVSFAIFGALILSLTYIPMMCAACFYLKTFHIEKNISDSMMDFLSWTLCSTIG
jgi:cobalt-zinc-cadmium resistance protein CzcA